MKKIAFVFPGQGSQYVGMGKDFYEQFPESKEVFDKASELLDMDMCELCFEENDRLNLTEYTQAAMVTTIGAMLKKIETMGIKPQVTAGLSLGEYAALVTAGVMDLYDAIRLVRLRGKLMQEAVPQGVGAMAAVLGMEQDKVEEACASVDGMVIIANYNCPGQLVISGEMAAVQVATEKLTEMGAKRVVTLNVSGPVHSPLLETAGEKLLVALDETKISKPEIPYVANVDAQYVTEAEGIKELLAKQISSSVRWQQSVENMIADGVEVFVEIGPGKTISSFVKKIDRSKTVINIDKAEDLEKLTALLESEEN
ncbi:MAG: ACP S-malonyltransferase [Lachnospiraceae bacterium]|nr:ACP S-malonyltransferase [Lachnospiraceae bacterium]